MSTSHDCGDETVSTGPLVSVTVGGWLGLNVFVVSHAAVTSASSDAATARMAFMRGSGGAERRTAGRGKRGMVPPARSGRVPPSLDQTPGARARRISDD